VQAGQPAPGLGLGRLGLSCHRGRELLAGDVELAVALEQLGHRVAEVDEQLDVEGGVDEPALRQGPRRPVGGRVLLGEVDPEQLLDHGAEADLGQARQTGAELGVEDEVGVEPDLAQAREILARGVQHPLLVADDGLQLVERADGRGVEQEHAAASPEHLDEVGALRVPVAGGALGVDRDRSVPRGDRLHGLEVGLAVGDDVHLAVHRVGGRGARDDRRRGDRDGGGGGRRLVDRG
jgi:hypothetical protein